MEGKYAIWGVKYIIDDDDSYMKQSNKCNNLSDTNITIWKLNIKENF